MANGFIVKIARQAAEHYAKTGDYMPLLSALPHEMLLQKACFVSIIENPGRRIKGFHGSVLPRTPNLAQEVVINTVEAIVKNNIRMRPMDAASYAYEVGVLGPIERITSKEHLHPFRYGLYIRSDKNKTATLLPNRRGIDTAEEQIATAIREARVNPKEESITMYRFPVTIYGS